MPSILWVNFIFVEFWYILQICKTGETKYLQIYCIVFHTESSKQSWNPKVSNPNKSLDVMMQAYDVSSYRLRQNDTSFGPAWVVYWYPVSKVNQEKEVSRKSGVRMLSTKYVQEMKLKSILHVMISLCVEHLGETMFRFLSTKIWGVVVFTYNLNEYKISSHTVLIHLILLELLGTGSL